MEERNKGTLGDDFAIQSRKDHYVIFRSSPFPFTVTLSVYFDHPCPCSSHPCPRLSRCSEPFRNPLLLDVAATENGRAHVITDGLVGAEQQMMPLLGFLAKSRREAEFPTEILMRLGH